MSSAPPTAKFPPPRKVPLCFNHFMHIAKDYHNAYVQGLISPPPAPGWVFEKGESKTSRKSSRSNIVEEAAPLRVQPMRKARAKVEMLRVVEQEKKAMQAMERKIKAAKQLYSNRPANSSSSKKRKAPECDQESLEKDCVQLSKRAKGDPARRISFPQRPVTWTEFRRELEWAMMREKVVRATFDKCVFGPKPWECGMCFKEKKEEIGESPKTFDAGHVAPKDRGHAPVAVMSSDSNIGSGNSSESQKTKGGKKKKKKGKRVVILKRFRELDQEMYKEDYIWVGERAFLLDLCVTPMVMPL